MSRQIPFTKMHGAGNDFVVFDAIREDLPIDLSKLAREIADRHFGVGFDQMLVIRASTSAEFRMDIYNADGRQVEMCANGIRAFYLYLREHGHTRADEIGVETLDGEIGFRISGGKAQDQSGTAVSSAGDIVSDSPVLSNPALLAGSTGKSRVGRISTPVRSRML